MSETIIDLETETRNGLKIPKRPKVKHGAFQIYTGEGKGKSTASLGLMLRAKGRKTRRKRSGAIRISGFRNWDQNSMPMRARMPWSK